MINNTLTYITAEEIERISEKMSDVGDRVAFLADVFRLNTLYMITKVGSGHLGTSFSAMDIVTWLWMEGLKNPAKYAFEPGDIYFSSKGHDVPGLYAILCGLKKLPFEKMHLFRRLHGLDGHPDVSTPYMITNTGSLGMGISKARGIAEARRLNGVKGKIFVLTGDGELQEGQIWESLQPTANHSYSEIMVIVDSNKIQSDSFVKDVSDLGDLQAKFLAFGWAVRTCDGHDIQAIAQTVKELSAVTDRPQVIIADTVKGKGVSFMEKMGADGFYNFHAGAMNHADYTRAKEELLARLQARLVQMNIAPVQIEEVPCEEKKSVIQQDLVKAYSQELVSLAKEESKIVALDGDLIRSCGLVPFSKEFPERFIECGIAEQDMVSMASGLALVGYVPMVHSLGCFLSTRPNEQIYNAATEHAATGRGKIIYVGVQAGLLPAGPGHSHQEVRAIASVGSVPKLILVEPANEQEMKAAVRWAVHENSESTYLRVSSVSMEHAFVLPEAYTLTLGRGVFIRTGGSVLIVAYGPVMLHEAIKAADLLKEEGILVSILNLPWLNRIDEEWFADIISSYTQLVTIDDHYIENGQGKFLAATLARMNNTIHIEHVGLEEVPVCGNAQEVLAHHKMDASSIIQQVKKGLSHLNP